MLHVHPSQLCGVSDANSTTTKLLPSDLRPLVFEEKGLQLFKVKDHTSELCCVRVFEALAKDITRHLDLPRKDVPDMIIKTFTIEHDNVQRSLFAEREVGALKWLNKLECKHVPELLCAFKMKNRFDQKVHVIVMEKIQGVTVSECYNRMTDAERSKVKMAFGVAIRAVAKHGVCNGSLGARNIMYSAADNKWYVFRMRKQVYTSFSVLLT